MCPFLQTTQEKKNDYDGLPTSIPIVGSLFAAPHHIAWSSGDAEEYMHIYNNPSASIQSTSLCPVHVYTKLKGWGVVQENGELYYGLGLLPLSTHMAPSSRTNT